MPEEEFFSLKISYQSTNPNVCPWFPPPFLQTHPSPTPVALRLSPLFGPPPWGVHCSSSAPVSVFPFVPLRRVENLPKVQVPFFIKSLSPSLTLCKGPLIVKHEPLFRLAFTTIFFPLLLPPKISLWSESPNNYKNRWTMAHTSPPSLQTRSPSSEYLHLGLIIYFSYFRTHSVIHTHPLDEHISLCNAASACPPFKVPILFTTFFQFPVLHWNLPRVPRLR